MEFLTRITIPPMPFGFSYEDQTVLLGSCFAENIGRKLEESRFAVDINPFGTLYNPASVAIGLRRLICPERYTREDLFQHEGGYHSFDHHSRFSALSEEECLSRINMRLEASSAYLRKATRLVITWGTAFVYGLRKDGRIVSNCHKLPGRLFDRRWLSVEEIVEDWHVLLLSLWERNPDLRVLFTVSPIRHWKDGAHGNQLSKATLLLAVDALQGMHPDRIAYFPSYEIMMDELRDYRFYADDMLHPSSWAIDYIWQRFVDHSLTKEAAAILKEWNEIQKALQHKPFQAESESYKRFILQTLLKMERLNEKFPSFDLTKEIESVKSKWS